MSTRPTLDEILDGMDRDFRNDILPELQSDWAKRMGDALLYVIAHVRLRIRYERLNEEEEHEELSALLAALASGGIEAPAESLEPAAGCAPEADSLDVLRAANDHDRAALEAIIRAYPRCDASDPAWAAITAYLARSLEREARLIPH